MRTKFNSIKETLPTVHGLTIGADGQLQEFAGSNDSIMLSPTIIKELGVSASLVLACIYKHSLTQTETDRDNNRWIQITTEAIAQETGISLPVAFVSLRYLKRERYIISYKEPGKVAHFGPWLSLNYASCKKRRLKA